MMRRCECFANLGQFRQLEPFGFINVDQVASGKGLSAVDFDQLATRPALRKPIDRHADDAHWRPTPRPRLDPYAEGLAVGRPIRLFYCRSASTHSQSSGSPIGHYSTLANRVECGAATQSRSKNLDARPGFCDNRLTHQLFA